jgi:hypothetical protein
LGEKQHDLGPMDLFTRSLSRDPVASYKKFGQTVTMWLEENLLNTVQIHIINKRSLLYALHAPHKVYSVNNYMLFCSLKNEMTGIFNTFVRFPVRVDVHFLRGSEHHFPLIVFNISSYC